MASLLIMALFMGMVSFFFKVCDMMVCSLYAAF
ncbi:hypothetical protein SB6424_05477 [Klebsiella pasteurii]|nr:hypothetical protein SB6416_05356 [Klebsiella pasteurii]VUS88080.1 hypothetical protein SB6424_05477 [Klebsiella pasteurii]